jgi:hypothetical protein
MVHKKANPSPYTKRTQNGSNANIKNLLGKTNINYEINIKVIISYSDNT